MSRRVKVGDRVGAFMSRTDSSVEFCGYGVYLGDLPCKRLGYRSNPKIQLDNGKQVWGCECWWGSEAEIQKEIAGITVNDASGQLDAFDPNDGPPADFGANCIISINCVFGDRQPTPAEADAIWNGLSKPYQSLASQLAPLLVEIQDAQSVTAKP